jgi:hypothetical protein
VFRKQGVATQGHTAHSRRLDSFEKPLRMGACRAPLPKTLIMLVFVRPDVGPETARPGKVRASQCGYPFWTEIFRISSPNRSPNRRARTFPGQAGPGRPLANLLGPISGSCLASIRSSASRGEPGRGGPRVRHVVSSFLGLGNVPER